MLLKFPLVFFSQNINENTYQFDIRISIYNGKHYKLFDSFDISHRWKNLKCKEAKCANHSLHLYNRIRFVWCFFFSSFFSLHWRNEFCILNRKFEMMQNFQVVVFCYYLLKIEFLYVMFKHFFHTHSHHKNEPQKFTRVFIFTALVFFTLFLTYDW